MVTHSRGEGSYQASSRSERNRGEGEGEVESTLTGLYPYGRYEVNERVAVWGVAGYGEGELTLTPAGQGPLRADMDLMMGAVGVRGVAVEAPAEGGVELSVTSDAMAVRTSSEAVRGEAGAGAGNLAAATRRCHACAARARGDVARARERGRRDAGAEAGGRASP